MKTALRAPFRRRTYSLLVNMLRAEPAFWRPSFWSSIVVAREALRRGAMQKIAELAPLLALVARRAPRTVLEIGTASGGTLYAWCRVAAPDATIVSVDLPGGPFGGRYAQEGGVPAEFACEEQTVHLLRLDSHAATTRERVLDVLGGRPLDFLMIDADHTYEGVKQDFEMYGELVRPGGLIAFHDVIPDPTLPAHEVGDVHLFWKEIRDRFPHRELFAPRDDRGWGGRWGGIGLLFWPDARGSRIYA